MGDPAPAVGSFSLHPALPITILATSLGFVVVQLDGSILNVALVQIGISLGTSVDGLQWTVDAYFPCVCGAAPFGRHIERPVGCTAKRSYRGSACSQQLRSPAPLAHQPRPALIIRAGPCKVAVQPCWFRVRWHFSTTLAGTTRGHWGAPRYGIWTGGGRCSLDGQARFWVVCWLAFISAGGAFFSSILPIGLIGIWLALRFRRPN